MIYLTHAAACTLNAHFANVFFLFCFVGSTQEKEFIYGDGRGVGRSARRFVKKKTDVLELSIERTLPLLYQTLSQQVEWIN